MEIGLVEDLSTLICAREPPRGFAWSMSQTQDLFYFSRCTARFSAGIGVVDVLSWSVLQLLAVLAPLARRTTLCAENDALGRHLEQRNVSRELAQRDVRRELAQSEWSREI